MPDFETGSVRIHFEERGAGDAVLLMPGVTDSAADLAPLIDALAARHRVIAPDLPGSGRSQPIPRAYSANFYREDADAMAALLADRGIAQANVAGFSDGGEVALLLAVHYPGVVRSALTWGAAGRLFPELASVLDAMHDCVEPDAVRWRSFGQHVTKRYGEEVARDMLRNWVAASRAILATGGDISFARAGEIGCPVLILAGERDPFCPPPRMRELADRIPRAELVAIEGGGHALHEERPAWFNETALAWLERQP